MRYDAYVRRATVILLVIFGVALLFSSFLLYIAPEGLRGGSAVAFRLDKRTWADIHSYLGFTIAGTLIIHAFVNWKAIKFHFRKALGL